MLAKRFLSAANRGMDFRFRKSNKKSQSAEKSLCLIPTFANIKYFSLVRDSNPVLLLFLKTFHHNRKSALTTRPSFSEMLLTYRNAFLSVRRSLKKLLLSIVGSSLRKAATPILHSPRNNDLLSINGPFGFRQ